MPRKFPLVSLLILSLLSPLAGTLTPVAKAQRARPTRRLITKMTEALRLRSEQARSGSRESVRVIINAQSG
ncbi:MAG: hypothetical protein LC731_03955, partial [Acidobacteria bacterium]|nr:hypothetical protein [Acidobacteriota bacterium]